MHNLPMMKEDSSECILRNRNSVSELHAQSALFELMGRLIEQEVDSDLLQMLRGEFRPFLEEAGIDPGDDFYAIDEQALLEVLAEEYTGLFVAPGCISPYLSVFETGALYRDPCDKVYRAYQAAGLDYRRCYSGEFPDHIGTMLSFVGYLYAKEAQALEEGDVAAADRFLLQRKDFMTELLGHWAIGWCRRASGAAFLPFYKQVLQLTEQLLWTELASLVDRRRLRELVELNRREPKKLDYDADFRKASGI